MSTLTQSKSTSKVGSSRGLGSLLGPYSEGAFAALRIVAGLAFAFHGMQGLFGVMIPPEMVPKVMSQGWIGSIIELVTGILIAAGAFTTWAAFLASGTMAVAYIQFHWQFAFDSKFFPAANQGEMSLIYCFLFLYIACRGGGSYSIDAIRNPLNTRN